VTYDVLVVGEVLVELSADGPLRGFDQLTLSFSGDALNAAAAAAAAGASVGLLARIGDDELGDALTSHVDRCGVDTALLRRVGAPNGVYMVIPDPDARGGFIYMRRGSAGSLLEPADVEAASGRVLVVSGIGQAISPSAAAAVEHAARRTREAGRTVVYDPNFRARLTTKAAARAALERIAPFVSLAIPSHPVETTALLGADTPEAAAVACRRLGADAVAVTCGADGVLLDDTWIPAAPAPAIVDATGAGDVFAGTVAAHLAHHASLADAVRDGVVAATRSLGARGGTGWLTWDSRVELATPRSARVGESAARGPGADRQHE
jgi:2-dehydro-3-deoxygluconokinase